MSELTEFLLARVAEDEVAAQAAGVVPWDEWAYDDHGEVHYVESVRRPARVLAECESKRRIVAIHSAHPEPQRMVYGTIIACSTCGDVDDNPTEWPCETIRVLAQPYADHPDFRQEWRA